MSEPAIEPAACEAVASADSPPEFEVFYDGACPLCVREIAFLRRRDARRGRIRFTDIAAPDFDAASLGKTHAELMAEIHGRLPNGALVKGVEVFRRLYTAIGFGWLMAVTRWPLIRPALDWVYAGFARRRLQLTGRCSSGECRVDGPSQR